jgi:hypothetical protein
LSSVRPVERERKGVSSYPLRWKNAPRNWKHIDVVHLNPDEIETKGEKNLNPQNIMKEAA